MFQQATFDKIATMIEKFKLLKSVKSETYRQNPEIARDFRVVHCTYKQIDLCGGAVYAINRPHSKINNFSKVSILIALKQSW